jgi:hypothetical protein
MRLAAAALCHSLGSVCRCFGLTSTFTAEHNYVTTSNNAHCFDPCSAPFCGIRTSPVVLLKPGGHTRSHS